MTIKKIFAVAAALAVLPLTGCRKDLCYDHNLHGTKVQVNIQPTWVQEWEDGSGNWQQNWNQSFGVAYDDLRPAIPSGLRVLDYEEDGAVRTNNIAPEGGIVSLSDGNHAFLCYNNNTEYIVFNNVDSWASASATTRTRTRASYFAQGHADEVTVNPPDMLYAAYVPDYTAVRAVEPDVLPVEMRPLVYTYYVRYEFKSGLDYVALARGALSGMARSVYLGDGSTSDEAVTVLYDCTLTGYGAEARVMTFGVASQGAARAVEAYNLNLEVRLKNGNMKNFDVDVTSQIQQQPRGGVIVVKDLEITDDEGLAGGSGFDVEVNGWGEYEDIPLPL